MGDQVHGLDMDAGTKMEQEAATSHPAGQGDQAQMCIRAGCNMQATTNEEWDEEYCSAECVIVHCKNMFSNWVSTSTKPVGSSGSADTSKNAYGLGSTGMISLSPERDHLSHGSSAQQQKKKT